MHYKNYFLILLFFTLALNGNSQRERLDNKAKSSLTSDLFDSIKIRNIGPGFMSGRIADIAIDPVNENTWYVAVGSGGVWKTSNAGTTFEPVFDDQGVYSIGCVTVDPNNSNIIWVGTGENVGGRHASFGDGLYKSMDGGETWKNMGLEASEHISKIIVHPGNSEIIYVAAQGPLWSSGGDRGFYKSIDGGETWRKTLGDDIWMGVTDIAIDPRDPQRLYAATWERHRTVAAVMDGSEATRIFQSQDGGETWKKLKSGLPDGKWGKIGLAVSPQDPDVVYAAIELNRRTGGVWRSTDRGASWEKMSNTVAGATGPHYYQEIFACPHHFDRLYLMNNSLLRSDDGGKTFIHVNEKDKHGDNHHVTFKASDPDYLLVSTDGGIYETFDEARTWRFMSNLPVTQYYKVAVDDAEPFYNIFGGTQDNSTQSGPSRTDNLHGIRNSDWKVILNWDGHQPATEPGNPDIVYAERQEGTLSRIDMTTGEVVDIQPQAAPGEPFERFNWDAPILVSPHTPTTIYFASQRVWKSEDRGDSWISISGDLTKNEERLDLPIMGKKQSWDSPWDVLAMSNYNTITSLAESPVKKGLIYVGTDDGLLQVTEDGGENWRKIEVSKMGVPATAFINDVKADLFDEGTVYVCLDNHKYGDFKPYLVKSTDKGKSWKMISSGIPDKHLVWRVVQDHLNKNLMFAGTEFGLFFTVNGGNQWTELNGGIPTISFRDLVIQRRENDLVAASFGRGFFILDDYSAFRSISNDLLEKQASLFTPRKAWWYIPRPVLSFGNKRGSQGTQYYVAPNPAFGATFTYYLKEDLTSLKEARKKTEKGIDSDIDFPGWEALENEKREIEPYIFLEVRDQNNDVVNRIKAAGEKGFNRITWDLKVAALDVLTMEGKSNKTGLMVPPGTYKARLFKYEKGEVNAITEEVSVEVEPLRQGALEGSPYQEVASFWRKFEELNTRARSMDLELEKADKLISNLWKAVHSSDVNPETLEEIHELKVEFDALDKKWEGYSTKNEIGEKNLPTVTSRLFSLQIGISNSTYGPTNTHKDLSKWIEDDLNNLKTSLDKLKAGLQTIGRKIENNGGPQIEGID